MKMKKINCKFFCGANFTEKNGIFHPWAFWWAYSLQHCHWFRDSLLLYKIKTLWIRNSGSIWTFVRAVLLFRSRWLYIRCELVNVLVQKLPSCINVSMFVYCSLSKILFHQKHMFSAVPWMTCPPVAESCELKVEELIASGHYFLSQDQSTQYF